MPHSNESRSIAIEIQVCYISSKGCDAMVFWISFAVYTLLYSLLANSYLWLAADARLLFAAVPAFLFINIFAGVFSLKTSARRLKICYHGGLLLAVFAASTLVSVIFHTVLAFRAIPEETWTFIWSGVLCICLEGVLFWNGIACVYLTSVQLGIRQRVIGIACGMIPIANLIALGGIIKTVIKEASFESEKEQRDIARRADAVCKTRYPILFVHGVFFRDSQYFNYWGRIPKALENNGAKIFYGDHQSAASVADSARELTERIKQIVSQTGCEKVNIIAHSKGGLDCRYALSRLDAAPYVASLTTVNTPHRGCLFADYLLGKIPENVKNQVANTYNSALQKFGDPDPDFLAAVNDLTASACAVFDRELTVPSGIFCQSIGSTMVRATGGKFPLNFSYHLVKHFDGPNDGLVSEAAFSWGERYAILKAPGNRGISHGDMIDLNRENIEGFDVREFYVNLVSELKDMGL